MAFLRLKKALIALSVLGSGLAGQVSASVIAHEPTPEPTYRSLRSDYVKTWYVYNDSATDGILDPGDTNLGTVGNLWTPTSSGTMMTYGDNQGLGAGQDRISAPMNWATSSLSDSDPNKYNPDYNYWLPRKQGTVSFFMNYSQFDNMDWSTNQWFGATQTGKDIVQQRNLSRNGWSMGWVVNDYLNAPGSATQTPAGNLNMDIAVHGGKSTTTLPGWGTSRSDPQVSLSDDIDHLLGQDNVGSQGQWHPANWDTSTQSYSWATNQLRMNANGFTDPNQLAALVASQEVKETVGFDSGKKDPNGNAYLYEDAFTARHSLTSSTTDGGMLAGLSGWNGLNAQGSNWADQQVIRIQIDPNSLLSSGIHELDLYDFGSSSPGSTTSGQVNPSLLAILVDANGKLFMNTAGGAVYFPDNIIYIGAANNMPVPEPASMLMLGLGAVGVVLRRRTSRA